MGEGKPVKSLCPALRPVNGYDAKNPGVVLR